ILQKGYIYYCPDSLNYFRFHHSSVTVKYNNNILNLIENYRLLRYLKTNGLIINNVLYKQKLNFFAGKWLTYSNEKFHLHITLLKHALKLDKLIMFRRLALWLKKGVKERL